MRILNINLINTLMTILFNYTHLQYLSLSSIKYFIATEADCMKNLLISYNTLDYLYFKL